MKIDKRTKKGRLLKTLVSKEMLCVVLLALLAACVLTKTLYDETHKPLLDPRGKPNLDVGTNKPAVKLKVQEVMAASTPCDYDPITYIRCSGERLGKSNQEIMQMIRIARAESGLRPDAIGVNRNGSVDRGVFQINSIHKDLSNKDAFDFIKNIDYAWKIQSRQGFRPWVAFTTGRAN